MHAYAGLEIPRFKNVFRFLGFKRFFSFFSTKIDVAKHESVTQKHYEICIP